VIRGKEMEFHKPKKKKVFHIDGEPLKKKKKAKIVLYPSVLNVIAGNEMDI
jgi:diacylglycerol kinase family enzyme